VAVEEIRAHAGIDIGGTLIGMHLKRVARQLGNGNLDARAKLPEDSGVAELGAAFNGMADNLQSLIQSRRELLNAVSHDLRTPIARLRYRLAMLEDGVADDVRSAMDRDISSIDKMIEELLLYSRLEQARDVLQPQTLALWPWLNGVVAQHAADFPDTDYQLTAVAPALHALTVDADPFYLERALSNLLRNAARYGQGRVEVSLGADETQCWIKVADNGPGIPEGERERVFEPFVRLDRSRDRRTGGYGLGLAIVQRIMGWHHGQASVATADLGGACFTLCWPRVHVVTSGHTSLTDEGESAA
jgi:two-component system sensor histidine kinase RstB